MSKLKEKQEAGDGDHWAQLGGAPGRLVRRAPVRAAVKDFGSQQDFRRGGEVDTGEHIQQALGKALRQMTGIDFDLSGLRVEGPTMDKFHYNAASFTPDDAAQQADAAIRGVLKVSVRTMINLYSKSAAERRAAIAQVIYREGLVHGLLDAADKMHRAKEMAKDKWTGETQAEFERRIAAATSPYRRNVEKWAMQAKPARAHWTRALWSVLQSATVARGGIYSAPKRLSEADVERWLDEWQKTAADTGASPLARENAARELAIFKEEVFAYAVENAAAMGGIFGVVNDFLAGLTSLSRCI